ncbi:hypothetical protein SAMN02745248_01312 [Hathewaya proteolytica DSM 3090]|uniref:Uncharacterized protein n=1 Tax=Hathewaya proteolytica DSM 3090 TaxID=1121331 RepID=A0A1M6N838_9CLOT|nr:hypothetical protein [Hathewaya proteolytica]SHJ91841.1 hypothetical protein SAMN02745248_01312 [Hathewaya proteolytica DSM 3090]
MKNYSSKKKLIIGISTLALLCIVAIVLSMNVFGLFMSPAEKVLEGFKNEMSDPSKHASMSISVSGMEKLELPEVLNRVSLKAESARTENKSYSKMALLLNNSSVIDFDVLLKGTDLFIGMGDKPLCINMKEILSSKASKNNFLEGIDFNDIFGKKYDNAILKELEDKVKKVGDKHVIEIDAKSLLKLIDRVFEVAQKDEEIADKLYDALVKIKANALKEKLDLGEEFHAFLDEPKDNVINSIKAAISMARVSLGQAQNNIPAELQFKIKIEVGALNRIKNANVDISIQGVGINLKIDNSAKVEIKDYTREKSTVIENVSSNNEQISSEVENYFVKAIDKIITNKQVIEELDKLGVFNEYKAMTGISDTAELINALKEPFMEQMKNSIREGMKNIK